MNRNSSASGAPYLRAWAASLAVVVGIIAGCAEPRTAEPVRAPEPVRAGHGESPERHCGPALTDLEPWLAGLVKDGDAGWFASDGFEGTPIEAPAEYVPLATLFRVHADHIALNLDSHRWVDTFSELETERAALLGSLRLQLGLQIKRSAKDPDRPVRAPLLQIDRRAPYGAIAQLIQLLVDTGYREVRFVFDGRPMVGPPPDTPLLSSLLPLSERNLSYRGTFDGPLFSALDADALFRDCPDVRSELSRPSPNTFQVSAKRLQQSLTPMLKQCRCQIDTDALKGLIWAWMGRADTAPKIAIAVRLAEGAKANKTIRAPAASAFGDIAPQIAASPSESLRFEVGD